MLNNLFSNIHKLNLLGSYVTLLHKDKFKFRNIHSLLLSIFFIMVMITYSIFLIISLINYQNLTIHQFCEEVNENDILKLEDIPIVIGLKLKSNNTIVDNIQEYISIQSRILYDMYFIDLEITRCFKNSNVDEDFLNSTIYNKENFYKLLSEEENNINPFEYQFYCLRINDTDLHFLNSRRFMEFSFQTNNYLSNEDANLIKPYQKKIDTSSDNKMQKRNENLDFSNLNLYVVSMFYSPKINLRNYTHPVLDQVHSHYQYFYSGYDKMDYFDISLGNIYTNDVLMRNLHDKTYEVDIHYSVDNRSYNKRTFSGSMTYGLSPFKTNYERNYLTIIELMTKIGGLGNFIFFFLTLVSKYINRYFFINDLATSLIDYFDFSLKEEQSLNFRNFRKDFSITNSKNSPNNSDKNKNSIDSIEENENSISNIKKAENKPNKMIDYNNLLLDKNTLNQNFVCYKAKSKRNRIYESNNFKKEDTKIDTRSSYLSHAFSLKFRFGLLVDKFPSLSSKTRLNNSKVQEFYRYFRFRVVKNLNIENILLKLFIFDEQMGLLHNNNEFISESFHTEKLIPENHENTTNDNINPIKNNYEKP